MERTAETDACKQERNTSVPKMPAAPSKSASLLPTLGNAFGTFQDPIAEEKENSSGKPAMNKKASRFEGLFKKEEPLEPLPGLAGLGDIAQAPQRPLSSDNATSDDQAGFQRILLMLGNKGLTPKPVESDNLPREYTMQSSDAGRISQDRASAERQRDSFIDDLLARQMASQERSRVQQVSRDMEQMNLRQQGGHEGSRMPSDRNENAQIRRDNFPRSPNEAAAGPPMQTPGLDPNKAFLLNLMNARMPEPQRHNEEIQYSQLGNPPKHMMQPQHMPQMNQRHAPSAPPGLEPQRRQPAEHDIASNRRPQQPPPGFFDQESNMPDVPMAPPGLPRRNTAESGLPPGQIGRQAPSQASNLGIPSMRMNESMMMRNGGHMGVDGRMLPGPPPGLMPNSGPQGHAPSGQMPPGMNGLGGPLPNNGMRGNMPPMGPPGFPPQGMPMNMHNMPPGPHGPCHCPMGPPHPQHPNHPTAHFNGGPPPGMFPMGGPGGQPGFFPPNGRGFPPGFDADMRGAPVGRGYQGL
jgi:curved DNA-binding protein CbpA